MLKRFYITLGVLVILSVSVTLIAARTQPQPIDPQTVLVQEITRVDTKHRDIHQFLFDVSMRDDIAMSSQMYDQLIQALETQELSDLRAAYYAFKYHGEGEGQ